MAITFPATPAVGDLFPNNPGVSGVTQYRWDGSKWDAVLSTISLGTANQGALNSYQWPATDGPAGYQLQTDGSGNLSWALESNNDIVALGINPLPDGVNKSFSLVLLGTLTPFTPVPSTNIVVFLGGVPQIPTVSYTVNLNQIDFVEAPLMGTSFYAISSTTS